MARKRLVGPATRQAPRLDGELGERAGDELEAFDVLEDVHWDGGAPECGVPGVEITRARLTGLRLTGLELADLRLLDVVLVDCELPGSDLYGARVSRSAFRRCDLTDVDVTGSDFDQVSLHGSAVDRLKGADSLHGLSIGSDQLVPLALPILHARRIRVDDDPPDLAC
jgi:uncharacterized protein YjbI with pentapeptide repeats